MTGQQAVDYILNRRRGGPKPGLSRMQMLMEKLGNPQEKLKCIHVSGTNGKGSCCTLVSSVLRAAGYKVGLTISPFVLEFRERIQIGGEMIPDDTLGDIVAEIKSICDKMDEQDMYCNQFEIITAAAFVYFYRSGCDYAVLEVGLGGSFDATNVITAPLVCAVMSISLDHTQLLGDTVGQIAGEKAGIIKPGRPVVCYPVQEQDALQVIKGRADEISAPFIYPDVDSLQDVCPAIDGCRFLYKGKRYHTPLGGLHQVYNCITALEVIFALQKMGVAIDDQAVQRGISGAFFPARIEIIHRDPLVIIDGAHNPSGANALSAALELLPGEKIGIIGLLSDKDSIGMARTLGGHFAQLFLVTPQNSRAKQASDLAADFLPYCSNVTVCDTLEIAVDMALTCQGDRALVICGSLYLASDARKLLASR